MRFLHSYLGRIATVCNKIQGCCKIDPLFTSQCVHREPRVQYFTCTLHVPLLCCRDSAKFVSTTVPVSKNGELSDGSSSAAQVSKVNSKAMQATITSTLTNTQGVRSTAKLLPHSATPGGDAVPSTLPVVSNYVTSNQSSQSLVMLQFNKEGGAYLIPANQLGRQRMLPLNLSDLPAQGQQTVNNSGGGSQSSVESETGLESQGDGVAFGRFSSIGTAAVDTPKSPLTMAKMVSHCTAVTTHHPGFEQFVGANYYYYTRHHLNKVVNI